MGKIKKSEWKFHFKSTSCSNKKLLQQTKECEKTEIEEEEMMMPRMTFRSNMFNDVTITNDMLKQQLPSVDTMSVISSKSTGPQMTKRDKRRMKHNLFLEKIDAIQTSKKMEKERIKRKKTPIVGDLKPLEDALPTLELLLKDNKCVKKQQKSAKPVSCLSFHSRQKHLLNEIAMFRQVVNDPSFKADPLSAVKTHLQLKFQREKDNA